MLLAPLLGWRRVEVTGTRAKDNYARVLKILSDRFLAAEKIVLVQDNLNTRHPSSLYEAFPPEEARRLMSALNGITRPGTAVGRTWPKSSLAS